MEWYRRYSNLSSHPQIIRAGFWGRIVFDALCEVSAEFDLGGLISDDFYDAQFLIRRLGLHAQAIGGMAPEAVIAAGLNGCLKAGLLVREGNAVVIDGWDRKQPKTPTKSTTRVRAYRERKRSEGGVKRDETVSPFHETGETSPSPLLSSVSRLGVQGEGAVPPAEPTLEDQLATAFREARGPDLDFDISPKDGQKLRLLQAKPKVTDAEILRRWRIALTYQRWPRASCLVDLEAHWNTYATPEPQGGAPPKPRDFKKGRVGAEEPDWKGQKTEITDGM